MRINQIPEINLARNYSQTIAKRDKVKSDGTSFRGGRNKDIAEWIMGSLAILTCTIGLARECTGHPSAQNEPDSVAAPVSVKKPVMDAKTVVLPPLTMIEGIDTIEFKSCTDSLKYQKYSQMARASHDKREEYAETKHDSVINIVKKDYDAVRDEAKKVLNAMRNEIDAKCDAQLKDAEEQYNNGKITFNVLDSTKLAIEQNREKEKHAAFDMYFERVNPVEEKYDSILNAEDNKFYKFEDENNKKLYHDIDTIRSKYCKNVDEQQTSKPVLQLLTQNIHDLEIKYHSKKDSIKAQKYINKRLALMQEHKTEYEKLSQEKDSIENKISELSKKIDETDYEGEIYNKLAVQNDKLYDKLDNLRDKISDMTDKYGLDLNEIRKYGEINLSSDYCWID